MFHTKKETVMKMKNVLLSKPVLKIHALILGFFVWFVISQNHVVSITKQVPLSFYNQPKNTQLYAPDTVVLSSFGPKSHLNQVFHHDYAVHIDLSLYQPGVHEIELTEEDIFLPPTVKLLQLKPSLIQIKIAQ